MREVYLIRHAEAHYDSAVPDARRPLSPRGSTQAAELVKQVEQLGIEEIHTSPYERCRHTIAPLAARLGLTPSIVDDFRERTFTARHVPDWAATWKTAWMDPHFAFDDGESGRQAQARMHAALLRVAAQSRASTLAVASHGNVIALVLHQISPVFTFEHACSIRNPDVLRVTFDGTALAWDHDFAVAGLDAFATRFA